MEKTEIYSGTKSYNWYFQLVLAVGTKSHTFGVPGVKSQEEDFDHNPTGTNRHNVFFLKQLEHARALRNRIIECFERYLFYLILIEQLQLSSWRTMIKGSTYFFCFRASNAHCSEEERRRLLTFLVVGGGPTSIEFARYVHDHVFKLPPRPKMSFRPFFQTQNKTRPFKVLW